MPAKRLSMRKIKEVLRLKWDKDLSNRQIARICGIGRPTVKDYLRRAAEAGLAWPLPSGLDETALERQLFPPPPPLPAHARGVPNWSVVHQELRSKKSVTLFLLWQEYRQTHLEGTSTAGFVNTTATGKASWMWSCARTTGRVRSCLLIMPARRCRWWTKPAVRSARRRSSSPCSVPPTTPMPRPPGHRACRTGSARMCVPSPFSAGCLNWLCRTIYVPV